MYKIFIVFLSLLFSSISLTANEASKVVISQMSETGIYQSKLHCENSISSGDFQNCWLKLFYENTLVEGVEVFVEGGMPGHAHGLPTSPKISWLVDKKVHLIQGLKFSMPGQWVLNFKVNAKNTTLKDQITMRFEVD